MSPREHLEALAYDLRSHYLQIVEANAAIRQQLAAHSDGKKLKGDEIVGWAGEVYGKLLLGGTLVSDALEHDFESGDKRVSVKARKGWGNGWQQTSIIPKIEGVDCPTHLMFVHLNDDYSVDRIWLYPWGDLISRGRFRAFVVRGVHRGFTFFANPFADTAYVAYAGPQGETGSTQQPSPSQWTAENAAFVKQRRMQLRLTQKDVADRARIGRTRYSFIEYPKNPAVPTPTERQRIYRVLGIPSPSNEEGIS